MALYHILFEAENFGKHKHRYYIRYESLSLRSPNWSTGHTRFFDFFLIIILLFCSQSYFADYRKDPAETFFKLIFLKSIKMCQMCKICLLFTEKVCGPIFYISAAGTFQSHFNLWPRSKFPYILEVIFICEYHKVFPKRSYCSKFG